MCGHWPGQSDDRVTMYLGEFLVVHVPDRGDLPGVRLLNGGDLLLQASILQLQAPHILNVGSEPINNVLIEKIFQMLTKVPTCHSAARAVSSPQSWISWWVREVREVLV